MRSLATLGIVCFALFRACPADAQVKPGEFFSADNARKIRALLPPGVYWRVEHGMTLRVSPTERIQWPPPYKDATEKYSAQVRLTRDHRSLEGYVAGQPFPIIDANDPYAAVKVMWNNAFRPMYSDDLDARFFGCHGRYEEREKGEHEVEYEEIGHYRIYNEAGRTEVEPLPVDPDFKITRRYFLAALYPVLAPQEIRGRAFIRYRYADPDRGDDAWFWQPGSRRLRRVNEDFLGSAQGVEQFYPDDYEGFSAKNENYEWRFLGEKTMLGAVDVEHVPAIPCESDGRASVCPERWQLRRVFVVEGRPRRNRVPEELYSRHVVYIDAEAWAVLAHDAYDRHGQLFKSFANWLTYRDRPVPDARVAIYPFKRVFEVAETTTDVQSGLAETCFLPSPDTRERETWYINMGASDKSMFTLQAVIDAAH